jgi:23S rRNA pseudouridine1911/1915/1917 synthase
MQNPPMAKTPFTILFEDTHLIVLSKPAGLLSQGEHTGDENLVDALRAYLGRPYVGLVHRLDRNTSGIMVVAKRTKSAQRLTDALQNDQIIRTYLGWLVGKLNQPVQWRHFLKKDPRTNIVRVSKQSSPQAKEAILSAKPAQYTNYKNNQLTLVEFQLETGRSHQIRVQSAFEGFPLLGDRKYGKDSQDFPRVALHSHRLEFPHPMSKEKMKFEDPLPSDMRLP